MSDPSPTSELLDQLVPGVVLAGRYSLKDRVPRWIAERRFKARDLESGEEVAVLVWSRTVLWTEEFLKLAEELPAKPFRAAERMQGGWIIITDWVSGMREAKGEAETAREILDQLGQFLPKVPVRLSPLRTPQSGGVPLAPVASRPRQRTAAISENVPVYRANSLVDWIGLGIALTVAILVAWFTIEWIHVVREPLTEVKKDVKPFFNQAANPVEAKTSEQLIEAQTLRKNGNATSALVLLLDLNVRTPENQEIQAEMSSLIQSLSADLENLRLGIRPALVRAIDRAAEAGNVDAIRLQQTIAGKPENAPNAVEPLLIR